MCHMQAYHVYISVVSALCVFSQQAQSQASSLPSTAQLTQQAKACNNPTWQCFVPPSEQYQIAYSTHAAVLAGNCTQVSTSLGLWQCSDNLVQSDVIAAIQNDSCSTSCIDSQRQLCTQPPAPAPAPSESLHLVFSSQPSSTTSYAQGRFVLLLPGRCMVTDTSILRQLCVAMHPMLTGICSCTQSMTQ